jgi:Fe-S-cluster containining protein
MTIDAKTGESSTAGDYRTANVALSLGARKLELEFAVPDALVRASALLPLFQSLANTLVAAAVDEVEAEGLHISCTKGCGACCRQLVPISEIEARRLRDLVAEMPEARRDEILDRFAAARRRLEASGMLDRLTDPRGVTGDALAQLGLDYFQHGIACPFLEAESCSIHPDRPISCREYLVTSPAENCGHPSAETVRCVRIGAKVSNAVAALAQGDQPGRWVPLVLALGWAEEHPDDSTPRPATELVQELFTRLTRQQIPAAAATSNDPPPF